MLFPRRYLIASACVVTLLTIYYLHYAWSLAGLYSGRTFPGRLLGVIGVSFIVAAFFSGVRRPQDAGKHEGPYPWHVMLGSLSIWVIFAHAGFRFGNLIAVCGLLFLIGVATNGFLIVSIDLRLARLPQGAQATQVRLTRLRRRRMSMHAILTAGLMAFVLIHILSIFYY